MGKEIDRIFAIGDIHGCVYELRMLLETLPLTADSLVIFLGDYIDRGPRSKEVIDTILNLKKFCQVITLMGNHEQMLLDYLKDPTSLKAANFIYNGGAATLSTYCTKDGEIIFPPDHMEFFNNLSLSYEMDKYFFVHAGVPEIPLKFIKPELHTQTMLWTRDKFLESEFHWEKKIIHGHTPVVDVDIHSNRINLDTGCVFNHKLSAMGFPLETIYSVPKRERTEHIFLRNLSRHERRRAERFEGKVPVIAYKDGQEILFETQNYSDLGMYLYNATSRLQINLQLNEIFTGEIRPSDDPQNHFNFKAKVVRIDENENGTYFGVDFVETPFEFLHKVINFKKEEN